MLPCKHVLSHPKLSFETLTTKFKHKSKLACVQWSRNELIIRFRHLYWAQSVKNKNKMHIELLMQH